MYYWLHRVDHSVRLFWATHVYPPFFNRTSISRLASVHRCWSPSTALFISFRWRFAAFVPRHLLLFAVTQTWESWFIPNESAASAGWNISLVTPPITGFFMDQTPLSRQNLGMLLIIWDRIFRVGLSCRRLPSTRSGMGSPSPGTSDTRFPGLS